MWTLCPDRVQHQRVPKTQPKYQSLRALAGLHRAVGVIAGAVAALSVVVALTSPIALLACGGAVIAALIVLAMGEMLHAVADSAESLVRIAEDVRRIRERPSDMTPPPRVDGR